MGQEIAFFINQNSGKGEALELAESARSELSSLPVSATLPESALELTELCRNLKSKQTRAAVVFGGDGTLNYALRGLVESEIPLYPFPSGTANDLASENGITRCPEQLSRLVETHSVRNVRLLEVNGVPFSTISGIGIGSGVCDDYNRLRHKFAFMQKLPRRLNCEVYSLLAFKNILNTWGKGKQVRLVSDEVNELIDTSILMVCNQSTLAGSLKVAPGQNPEMDQFTVIYHKKRSGASTVKALAGMKLGHLDPEFVSFKTKNLRVESLNGEPLPVFGDGEILTRSPTLQFTIHPKRLRVFSEC